MAGGRQHRQIYDRVILDLCGGTGSWSRPYREAGYDVRLITLPEQDVRWFQKLDRPVHGVLAAPPCTHFSMGGNWLWKEKDADGRTVEGVSIVDACLRIIQVHDPVWWCLENPAGRLQRWLGEPKYTFHPYEYGDPWPKKTCLWGDFTIPEKDPVDPTYDNFWVRDVKLGPKDTSGGTYVKQHAPDSLRPVLDQSDALSRKDMRAITPPGFARAFFEANP